MKTALRIQGKIKNDNMTNAEKIQKKFREIVEILGKEGGSIIAVANIKDETAAKEGKTVVASLVHGGKKEAIESVASLCDMDPCAREILCAGALFYILTGKSDKTEN